MVPGRHGYTRDKSKPVGLAFLVSAPGNLNSAAIGRSSDSSFPLRLPIALEGDSG